MNIAASNTVGRVQTGTKTSACYLTSTSLSYKTTHLQCMTKRPIQTIATGLSVPIHIFNRLEMERGDISRSRYLLKIIQQHYDQKDRQKETN